MSLLLILPLVAGWGCQEAAPPRGAADLPPTGDRWGDAGSTSDFTLDGITPEQLLDDAQGVDFEGGAWERLRPLPEVRTGVRAVELDGLLYVAGGMTDAGDGLRPAFAVWVFDPETGEWDTPTIVEEAIRSPILVAVDGLLLLASGWGSGPEGGWTPSTRVWTYAPETRLWTARAPLPLPLAEARGAMVGGRMHVLGVTAAGTREVHLTYDPRADQWGEEAPPPGTISGATVAEVGGHLIVAGGRGEAGAPGVEVRAFHPESRSWTARAPLPRSRSGATGAVLDGRLYLLGGEVARESGGVAESWRVDRYDPTGDRWERLAPSSLPPAESWAVLRGGLHGVGSLAEGLSDGHQGYLPPG